MNNINTLTNKFEILLIENKEADIYLAKNALKELQSKIEIKVLEDGEAAIQYFKKTLDDNLPGPSLILLDTDLPKISGFEVLQYIKTSEKLKIIPTLMLCSSSSYINVLKSYKLKANAYIKKPHKISDYKNTVKTIENFWFHTAKLHPQ